MTQSDHHTRPRSRRNQRVRDVRAFAQSILSHRSRHAIETNQMRLAFARAVGIA